MAILQDQPFNELAYQRIDYEFVVNELRRARLHLRLALSAAAAIQAISEMQAAMRLYATQSSIARIRHNQNTSDPFYAAEQDYYDQADARIAQLIQSFYTNLMLSRFKADLEKRYGSLIFRKALNHKGLVSAAVVDDLAEENRLASSYLQIMSAATVSFGDQVLTLDQLEPMKQAPEQYIRKTAHQAEARWHAENASALDRLFDQMVAVRQRISHKLGLKSFTDLGYRRMERFDYTRADVENLRRAVIRYIVPLTLEIRRLQRRRLGLERLYHYDLPCLFPNGNPKIVPKLEDVPQIAADVLAQVTRQQTSFFQPLIDGGYLDFEARSAKAPGGFCDSIVNAGRVFILMNATGTKDDVATLLHEAGHAYAGLKSLQDLTLLEYRQPSLDICEIHSTAMEYFCYPQMDKFFGADAENYTLMHMTESLLSIPYCCLVDEFQHVVYDRPDMTIEQRHRAWRDLEKIYQPDLVYDDAPFFNRGGAWHKKEHIFVAPFYYIDYVLAQLTALDLWRVSRVEPDQAWHSYDKLCSLAGRHSFGRLLEQTGLASPFDQDTIKRVAYAACDFIDL